MSKKKKKLSKRREEEKDIEVAAAAVARDDVDVSEWRAEEVAQDARAAAAAAPAAGGRLHLPRPLRPPQLRDAAARAAQLHLPLRGEQHR